MKKKAALYILLLLICVMGGRGMLADLPGILGEGLATQVDGDRYSSDLADEASAFEVHYIDVGQADAALVRCDGRAMLIDGGNREDSRLIYTYLKRLGIQHLDYVVCTHPHEDHVGGLTGALNYATVGMAYAPMEEDDHATFQNFKRHLNKQGVEITVPAAGDTFSLGSAEVTVVGPVEPVDPELEEDLNNRSLVLRIVYGETSFLFTGDAEREEEQTILDAGYEIRSTVLKVGHHGASDSTSYPFLREAAPEYAVISAGADNLYGHPHKRVLSRLQDADVEIYRTDEQGTVVCVSDGERVFFKTGSP